MTVAGKDISVEEFERIYKKNNNSIHTNQQTPEEYAELFINFKLKVAEAENLGMDTTKAFLTEFNKYKEQLAQPYLTDDETKEELMREAYERAKFDVHASHILINMNPGVMGDDTLATWEKTMAIRQRILDGEDFATVARATSDDPSAKSNGGDLGFFTVFTMLYTFESAAYSLEVGEISMPVRTRFGYHIVKLNDKRPAIGQVKVRQIYVRAPQDFSEEQSLAAQEKIEALYDSIQNGRDFSEICKLHSDDRSTAENGGELPYFGTGRMFPLFERTAFSLENPGDISMPFKSNYGWHMMQLIDKKPVGSYEEMESTLQTNAIRGDRGEIKKERYLQKLKNTYEYELKEGAYKDIYSQFDETVFEADWHPEISGSALESVLFTTNRGNKNFGDFIQFLSKGHRKETPQEIPVYLDKKFSAFVEASLMEIEKSTLPERYPEYKYILQEYHDGILLFDLMDKRVWTHAVEDTAGLEAFHAKNKDKYMWEDRVEAMVVSCDSLVDIPKLKKIALKKIVNGKWDEDKLNKKYGVSDSVRSISLETIKVEAGINAYVDALNKTVGVGETYNERGKNKFVIVKEVIDPMPKELNETRGQVTSDYQDQLEKQWLEELRSKYEVKVNKDLLSRIKQ